MCKSIRVFRRKRFWLLAGAIALVAIAGMVSPHQRVWAQPPVPVETEFPTGENIPCDRGPSPEYFIKTGVVRTPIEQVLVMVIDKAPRGQRTTVVAGAYFADSEDAMIAVGLYKLLCAAGEFDLAGPVVSQQSQPFTFEVGNGASDVSAADFNNDGIDDLVFSNGGSDSVSILLGAADLSLGPATAFAAGDRPAAIAVGDLNQDGNVDVVTANTNFPNENLTVMFGNGNGTLQAPISLASEATPLDVDVGDINGDTIADIVFTSQNTGLSTIISNGNGTFQAPTVLDNNLFPFSVQLVDMNADGIVDVLSSLAIRLGNGDGTFQAPLPFPTRIVHFFATAGDLNNDDVLDVAAVSSSANAVTAMLGVGDGTLQSPVHYAVGDGPQYVEIQEIEGDNFADLVVSNTSDDHATILFGNGDGTFAGTPLFPASQGASGIVLADFTGDGIDDIATGSNLNRPVSILPGLAPGRYGIATAIDTLRGIAAAGGDFNNDGNPDFLVVSSGNPGFTNDSVTLAQGNGDGTFGNTTVLQLPEQDRQANPAIALDVNNDSNLDILTANNSTGDISIFLGNGDGSFQDPSQIALGVAPGDQSNFIVQGLFNADAIIDLAIITPGNFNANTGGVSILLGDGVGAFTVGQNLVPNTEPSSGAAGDFNNDGINDLAVYFSIVMPNFDTFAMIFPGLGDGSFGPSTTIPFNEFFGAKAPNIGDFNLDGNVDLLVSLEESSLSILHGNGDGTFGAPIPYDAGSVGQQTLITDLNLDSRPDILVANNPNGVGSVVVLLNSTPIAQTVQPGEQGD